MIKLNLNAKNDTIKKECERGIEEIKGNAERGIRTTELVFGKEIHSEVRDKIEEYMKKNKISYQWISMRGPVGMQGSIAYGDGRLMKFYLKEGE